MLGPCSLTTASTEGHTYYFLLLGAIRGVTRSFLRAYRTRRFLCCSVLCKKRGKNINSTIHSCRFQPRALLIKGDLPWKKQGETNQTFIQRLKQVAIAKVASSYPEGKRPIFYEDFGKQTYWVGGEWRGHLQEGLYAVVVFDNHGHKGNILLGMNEKEAWTPDLFKYAGELMPIIGKSLCDPHGFTGKIP
jgi:hypothetical protein